MNKQTKNRIQYTKGLIEIVDVEIVRTDITELYRDKMISERERLLRMIDRFEAELEK